MNNMKETNRTVSSTEVVSTYDMKNQTITLTSRFNHQFDLEELIYEIILRKVRKLTLLSQTEGLQGLKNVL